MIPSHIDMGVGDRGEPGGDVVREPVRILIPKALYASCIYGDTHTPDQRHAIRLRPSFRPEFNLSDFLLSTGFNGQEFVRPGNVRLTDRTPATLQKAESVGISIGWHWMSQYLSMISVICLTALSARI
jgi:hypothetical protein